MFWLLFPDELLPAPDAEELLLPTEDVSSSYAWVIEPLSIVPLSVIPTVRFPFLAVFSLVTVVVFVSSFLFMTLKTTTTVIHAIRITETATFFILFLRDFDVICFFSLSAIFPLSFRFIIHYSTVKFTCAVLPLDIIPCVLSTETVTVYVTFETLSDDDAVSIAATLPVTV